MTAQNRKAANRYGVTPLSLACENGNVDAIGLLLDAGADPNTALPGGETALVVALRGPARSVVLLASSLTSLEERPLRAPAIGLLLITKGA